jgi:hypothetical protein
MIGARWAPDADARAQSNTAEVPTAEANFAARMLTPWFVYNFVEQSCKVNGEPARDAGIRANPDAAGADSHSERPLPVARERTYLAPCRSHNCSRSSNP